MMDARKENWGLRYGDGRLTPCSAESTRVRKHRARPERSPGRQGRQNADAGPRDILLPEGRRRIHLRPLLTAPHVAPPSGGEVQIKRADPGHSFPFWFENCGARPNQPGKLSPARRTGITYFLENRRLAHQKLVGAGGRRWDAGAPHLETNRQKRHASRGGPVGSRCSQMMVV